MILYTNIGELSWSTGGTKPQTKKLSNVWLRVKDKKILGFGTGKPETTSGYLSIDCKGRLLTPALIDCHTHLVFGGDRSAEFCQRLRGKTYQEIAAEGGGIQFSVTQTRSKSEDDLYATAMHRLEKFRRRGVTTIEIKSGYGLSIDAELKMLRVIQRLKANSDMKLFSTCLALHDAPKDMGKNAYIKACTDELLPKIAADKLADFVDVFLEKGYFSESSVDTFMQTATQLGLKVKVHADEFADSGGASAAANWKAVSADHLQAANPEGLSKMAQANTIAVLLPGTSLYTRIPFASATKMREAGLAMAVGSDYNPGSCAIENLAFLACMAGVHCGLTAEEVFASVTTNAGMALGIQKEKLQVAEGNSLDFCLWPFHSWEQWVADAGQTMPMETYINS